MSVSREVFSKLTSVARRMDVSRGAVVRMALQEWFKRNDPDPKAERSNFKIPVGLRLNLKATPETQRRVEGLLKTQLAAPDARRKRNRVEIETAQTETEEKS